MAYIHFDIQEIEATMRNLREVALGKLLVSTSTASAKTCYLQQDRFFEAQLAAQLQMFALLNEQVAPGRIGKVIGSFVGTIIVNTLSASSDPETCLAELHETMNRIINVLSVNGSPDVHKVTTDIVGTAGGRA